MKLIIILMLIFQFNNTNTDPRDIDSCSLGYINALMTVTDSMTKDELKAILDEDRGVKMFGIRIVSNPFEITRQIDELCKEILP